MLIKLTYRVLGAHVPEWSSVCFESFPYWAYHFLHGWEEFLSGVAAGVETDLKVAGTCQGTVLLGRGWRAWVQIYSCVVPACVWASLPCFCLLHDSALWQHLSPWRAGRPLGAHLSSGGD